MTKVKICGITNISDALAAVNYGADYLGFLVEIDFSEDSITREEAKILIKKLPLEVQPVLVTYLTNPTHIIELAEEINPDIIQLHNPEIDLKTIGKKRKALPKIKLTKVIHVQDESAIEQAKEYEKHVDFILLDSKTKDKLGGTGITHNWEISKKIVKSVKTKVFLAGGLNPKNIQKAIKEVKPFAVDTNSGVKAKPRLKDRTKLKKIIEYAKK
jgi:phosphoribosylanthranilate isomerase